METVTVTESLAGLASFFTHFCTAVTLMALFCFVYGKVTPYSELQLIREGKVAPAISFSGATIGFVLPLGASIAQSVSYLDMLVWGGVALVAQIAVFVALRIVLGDLVRDIAENRIASATILAAFSIATGILAAACMTY